MSKLNQFDTFVIFTNESQTQMTLTTLDNWNKRYDLHSFDSEGNQTRIIARLNGIKYTDAKKIFNVCCGISWAKEWEIKTPMLDKLIDRFTGE